MVRVKICGITTPEDAAATADAGADAIGLVFAASPRRVTPEQARKVVAALPPFVAAVGVFVDSHADEIVSVARDVGLSAVQLHGERDRSEVDRLCATLRVIKAFRVRDRGAYESAGLYPRASAYLFDAYVEGVMGGTGKAIDRELLPSQDTARAFAKPWILAGGLTPENVERALAACRPYGVDVSSGVEESPGRKSAVKVREFIARVRGFQREECGTLRTVWR